MKNNTHKSQALGQYSTAVNMTSTDDIQRQQRVFNTEGVKLASVDDPAKSSSNIILISVETKIKSLTNEKQWASLIIKCFKTLTKGGSIIRQLVGFLPRCKMIQSGTCARWREIIHKYRARPFASFEHLAHIASKQHGTFKNNKTKGAL